MVRVTALLPAQQHGKGFVPFRGLFERQTDGVRAPTMPGNRQTNQRIVERLVFAPTTLKPRWYWLESAATDYYTIASRPCDFSILKCLELRFGIESASSWTNLSYIKNGNRGLLSFMVRHAADRNFRCQF